MEITVNLISGANLLKRNIFSTPSVFAILTLSSAQTQTSTCKKSLNPFWNETFVFTIPESTTLDEILTVQLHDQNSFLKEDQGFLGTINVKIDGNDVDVVTMELMRGGGKRKVAGTVTLGLKLKSQSQQAATSTDLIPASSVTSSSTPTGNVMNPNQDLPEGYEARRNLEGRVYYLNHHTRMTSWIRPAAGMPAATTVALPPLQERVTPERVLTRLDLPQGWEQSQTEDGRTYYLNHNLRITTWKDPRLTAVPPRNSTVQGVNTTPTLQQIQVSSNLQLGPLPSGWEMRQTNANRIYFVDHTSKLTTWDDPRLPSAVDLTVPQYKRDFRRKLVYFRSQAMVRPVAGQTHIVVRRDMVLEDSKVEIMRYSAAELRKRLMIKFQGEEGLDYGGLSREFFYLLSHEMFDLKYGLFEYSTSDGYSLQINSKSGVNPDHLEYFKFIGRVVGLAVFHQRFLDVFFVPAFYKMLLGKPILLKDMEGVDSELFRSLEWSLKNDVEGVLDNTFTTEEDIFGEIVERELIENGKNIPVDNSNKKQYVDLITKWRIQGRVEQQLEHFKQGFYEIIPEILVTVFDERELELLIGDVDMVDWKRNTEYRGYKEDDQIIVLFWKIVTLYTPEQKSRLLQFVTGTSRIPVNGFKDLQGSDGPRRFTIEKIVESGDLPKAHTCFNRLDLPCYRNEETLEKKLGMAVEETMGFTQE